MTDDVRLPKAKCPFCGRRGVRINDASVFYVECGDLRCDARGPVRDKMGDAVDAWDKADDAEMAAALARFDAAEWTPRGWGKAVEASLNLAKLRAARRKS